MNKIIGLYSNCYCGGVGGSQSATARINSSISTYNYIAANGSSTGDGSTAYCGGIVSNPFLFHLVNSVSSNNYLIGVGSAFSNVGGFCGVACNLFFIFCK
jgi:hypothetical protein